MPLVCDLSGLKLNMEYISNFVYEMYTTKGVISLVHAIFLEQENVYRPDMVIESFNKV
jgi:hypothetical protein